MDDSLTLGRLIAAADAAYVRERFLNTCNRNESTQTLTVLLYLHCPPFIPLDLIKCDVIIRLCDVTYCSWKRCVTVVLHWSVAVSCCLRLDERTLTLTGPTEWKKRPAPIQESVLIPTISFAASSKCRCAVMWSGALAAGAVGPRPAIRARCSYTALETGIFVLPVPWREGAHVSRVRWRRFQVRVRRYWPRRPSNGVQGSVTIPSTSVHLHGSFTMLKRNHRQQWHEHIMLSLLQHRSFGQIMWIIAFTISNQWTLIAVASATAYKAQTDALNLCEVCTKGRK